MMFNRFYNMEMMNTSAFAPSANADSSCAHTARTSHTANTAMIAIMDAIIMASIIICALVLVLLVLAASAHTPLARITA